MTIIESRRVPAPKVSGVPPRDLHRARAGATGPDRTTLAIVGALHRLAMSLTACIALVDRSEQDGYWGAIAMIDQTIHDVRQVVFTRCPGAPRPTAWVATLVDRGLESVGMLVDQTADRSNDILGGRLDQLRDEMSALTAMVHPAP